VQIGGGRGCLIMTIGHVFFRGPISLGPDSNI
jgi:hypothetical protein